MLRAIVVVCVILLSASDQQVSRAIPEKQRPAKVNRCERPSKCVPTYTAPLLVYVVDELNAGIGGARVTITPPAEGPRGAPQSVWTTDWHGLAAISLQPDRVYRIDISASAFMPAQVDGVRGTRTQPSAIKAMLPVDWSQFK